jgi:hypothetical protein
MGAASIIKVVSKPCLRNQFEMWEPVVQVFLMKEVADISETSVNFY